MQMAVNCLEFFFFACAFAPCALCHFANITLFQNSFGYEWEYLKKNNAHPRSVIPNRGSCQCFTPSSDSADMFIYVFFVNIYFLTYSKIYTIMFSPDLRDRDAARQGRFRPGLGRSMFFFHKFAYLYSIPWNGTFALKFLRDVPYEKRRSISYLYDVPARP